MPGLSREAQGCTGQQAGPHPVRGSGADTNSAPRFSRPQSWASALTNDPSSTIRTGTQPKGESRSRTRDVSSGRAVDKFGGLTLGYARIFNQIPTDNSGLHTGMSATAENPIASRVSSTASARCALHNGYQAIIFLLDTSAGAVRVRCVTHRETSPLRVMPAASTLRPQRRHPMSTQLTEPHSALLHVPLFVLRKSQKRHRRINDLRRLTSRLERAFEWQQSLDATVAIRPRTSDITGEQRCGCGGPKVIWPTPFTRASSESRAGRCRSGFEDRRAPPLDPAPPCAASLASSSK